MPGTCGGDDQVAARGRWALEVATFRVAHPRTHALARWLWVRPDAVVVVAAALLGGLLQNAAQQGDAALFLHSSSRLGTEQRWDAFSSAGLQIGPAYLAALWLVGLLSSALHVSAFALAGTLQSAAVAWLAVDVLKALDRQAGRSSPLASRWTIGYCLLVAGFLAEAVLNGHPEELIAALLVLRAAVGCMEGESWQPAVLVALAGTLKLWGLMGAPLLLAPFVPKVAVKRLTVTVLLVAILYFPFFAFGTVTTFDFGWTTAPDSVLGLLTGYHGPFTWPLRLLQAGAVAGSTLVLLLRRVSPSWCVVSLIAVRLVLDPLDQYYYWTALWLVAAIATLTTSRLGSSGVRISILVLAPSLVLMPYVVTGMALAGVHLAMVAALAGVAFSCREPAMRFAPVVAVGASG